MAPRPGVPHQVTKLAALFYMQISRTRTRGRAFFPARPAPANGIFHSDLFDGYEIIITVTCFRSRVISLLARAVFKKSGAGEREGGGHVLGRVTRANQFLFRIMM